MIRLPLISIVAFLFGISACSTTATGPITKREYKVQVGGWQDMDRYNEVRDEVVEDKQRGEDYEVQCGMKVDCPETMSKPEAE